MKILELSSAILLLSVLSVISCNQEKNKSVRQEVWGTTDSKEVYLLTLTNKQGNVIKLTNYGAKINWIEVPDRNGKRDNITFGYDTFGETLNGDMSFGSVVGRYANRISNGRFSIDGVEYITPLNNGPNTLHGGPKGWHSVVWDTEILKNSKEPSVRFSYLSPDMEQGFPGNVKISVNYTWTDNNEIVMDYEWTADKKTHVNVTNHAYFNLHGAGNGNILDHQLTIKASAFTPVDSVMIPTGEIRQIAGTPFDFRTSSRIGDRINDNYDQLILGKGYDHNFILDNKEEVDVVLYEPVSGRMIEVITDEPGMQFYAGNFLDGTKKGHGGKIFEHRSGLCLEADHYPNTPNMPDYPSTLINPREVRTSRTVYRFTVK